LPARIEIPVVIVPPQGISLGAGVAADPVAGHQLDNDGRTALVMENGDTDSHTVTVLIPGEVDVGVPKPPRLVVLPPGQFSMIWFKPEVYNQPGLTLVYFGTDSASVTLWACRLSAA
jgi:hypothetical protein